MDRLVHRNTKRCIGPCLIRKAFTATALGVLCAGIAHGQVDVESVILTSNTTAPDRPLKMTASDSIQPTIGSPASAEASCDSAGKGPSCTGPMHSYNEVTVPVGKSTVVQLPESVRSHTVGNPDIVQATLVSPQTLYVLGLGVDSTNMIVQGRSGLCSVVDVAIGVDPGNLQSALRESMPEARNAQMLAAADSLVLGDSANDSVQTQKAVDIINALVMRHTHSPNEGDQNVAGQGGQQLRTAGPGVPLYSPRIINMMAAEASQQVILEVKAAEVSKTLIDQIGAAFNTNDTFGSWLFGAIANFLSGSSDTVNLNKANHPPLKFALDAQKGDGLVKVLAEPSPIAISGQEASFLASGKVFIPVAQGATTDGAATIVLQEGTFDVGLCFTPTVMENEHINLKVSPEMSEPSPTDMAIIAPNSNNTPVLPLITIRRTSTMLQVHGGQSFAISSFIKNNVMGSLKAPPGIGELPIIGLLVRSTSFQQDQTRLLPVVVPRLVKSLPAQYPLPTGSFGTINRGELYLNNNMEDHIQTSTNQLAAVATPTINPEKAAAEPVAAPGPSVQAPTPISVSAASTASVASAAPAASVAPRDTQHFVATGEQSTGS